MFIWKMAGASGSDLRIRSVVAAVLLAGFVSSSSAEAQLASFTPDAVSGIPGDAVTGEVLLDTFIDTSGWSYSVCVDTSVVTVEDAQPGSIMDTISLGGPPDFQSITFDATGVHHSVVICTGGCDFLLPGMDYSILELDYALVGSPGSSGDICICPGGVPVVPPTLLDIGGNPVSIVPVCSQATIDCPVIIPNRAIETFEVLPRAGEPGRYDLRLEWMIETTSPSQLLGTRVVFEVDGTLVGSESLSIQVGPLDCCDIACSSLCGTWSVGGSPVTAQCEPSVLQGACACRLSRITTLDDIAIMEGQQVTARVVATPGTVQETIVSDDQITRLPPVFNREILRVVCLPTVGDPSSYTFWALVRITASEVDAPIDMSFVATVDAAGNGGMTEVEIKAPSGVDPCLLVACGTQCFVPNSGELRGRCNNVLCATCSEAQGLEIDSLVIPAPGVDVDVMLEASVDALAEAIVGDEVFSFPFSGPIAAPNRRLRPDETTYTRLGPDVLDIEIAWSAETGAPMLEDLDARFTVSVNGLEVGQYDSDAVSGVAASCSGIGPCSGTSGTWIVAGNPLTAICRTSLDQGVCVGAVDLVQTLTGIPAGLGDVVTVRIEPKLEAMPEIFDDGDEITFTVGATAGRFRRSDVDASGATDIADGISILSYLFSAGSLVCDDAADVNDDGAIDIADSISLLSYLFQGAATPQPPFPGCGVDPTLDSLDCDSYPGCP